jgi:uncharacterized protein (TIGR01777 family)
MSNKTIGITGGTGFVGRHITRILTGQGHKVIIFSRNPKPAKGGVQYAVWHPDGGQIDKEALQRIDAMINLAGAGVADKRWTAKRKEEIRKSRVEATYFLLQALKEHAPKCTAFAAASATGYYGPDREGLSPFTEAAPPYHDFLASVCADWEAASLSAADKYRTTVLRTGIVLGKDGGAWPELTGPMRFGIMPILGSGRQVVSWIHVEDLAGIYIEAVLNEAYNGVYNAVASHPVTHRVLMQTIAKAKGGLKIPAPVPPFVLQLIMGDASVEVLKSCTVSNEKVGAQGFAFQYPTIEGAVASIVAEG